MTNSHNHFYLVPDGAADLKIQDGAITEIQTGSCEFEGKVKYQDLTLAKKIVGPIELIRVPAVTKQEPNAAE